MVKEKTGKVIRDEKGRIIQLENFPEYLILAPFIDDVSKSIANFNEDTQKYSKRMEKLTIAMLILAVTQCLLAIVSVALFIL